LCALLFSACATPSEEPEAVPAQSDEFPVTIDTDLGSIEIQERPENIVSLSPTATEMLFAVGAGDQVVAVDDQSDFPPEAPTTDLSEFEPNVEAIASYDPDLVVTSGSTADLKRSLGKLDIPMLLQPAATTFEDTFDQLADLGTATGNVSEAADVVEEMRDRIDDIVGSIGDQAEGLTYYHELDDTYFTATSETFIGEVYSVFGLANIADEAKGAGTGYPQLSAEYIVEADPDLIFLADTKCCGQSAETVGARPGWGQIAAVQEDAVVPLDDSIASRWGPRIVDYLETVADAVTDLLAARS
jgi:iron complex transport system substrate-binding protein